jgi:hypothetical protein
MGCKNSTSSDIIKISTKFHEILSSRLEIWHGQVHGPRKERRKRRIIIITRYDYNRLWSFPNRPLTTGLKNKSKATFEIFKKFLPVAIFKMATTILHKFNIVRFQCPELIPDIKKFLPIAIFKMATTISQKFNIGRFQRSFVGE